ncbi:MAG: hypothetical protein V3T49_04345 [Dehalococcoidia bacterium]
MAMLNRPLDSTSAREQTSTITKVHLPELEVIQHIAVDAEPYDIEVTSDGYLYVNSGDGGNSFIKSFQTSTGEPVDEEQIGFRSRISMAADEETLYAVYAFTTPSEFEQNEIAGGVISWKNRTVYDGNNPVGFDVYISSDRERVFTSSGYVLRAEDLSSEVNLEAADIWHMDFDLEMGRIYATVQQNLISWDYRSLEEINRVWLGGRGGKVFARNRTLYVLSQTEYSRDTTYSIRRFDSGTFEPIAMAD